MGRSTLVGHNGSVFGIAFSPDGKTLASGSEDTTVLLWNVSDLGGNFAETNPGPKELDQLWADLAGRDRAAAYRALGVLAGAKDKATPFLKQRLQPMPEPDPKRVQRLIADLDGDDFNAREEALRQLAQLDGAADAALRKALAGDPSTEARRRLETALASTKPPRLSDEGLRRTRAVQVLEQIASLEARQVLESLSQGAADANLTRDAKAALGRLNQHSARR